MVIDVALIRSLDWSPKLGAEGEVLEALDDVDQAIQIILTTPKGSDPLRPEFGTDILPYIDYPIDLAVPTLVREVFEAIAAWEPRVELVSVSPTIDLSQLTLAVTWRLIGNASQQQITEVVFR